MKKEKMPGGSTLIPPKDSKTALLTTLSDEIVSFAVKINHQ